MDPVIVAVPDFGEYACRVIAGLLLDSVKHIKSIQLKLDGPLSLIFFAAAYQYVRDSPISVNDKGRCVVGKAVEDTSPDCDVIGNAGPPKVAHRV